MNLRDYAILAGRCYSEPPLIGDPSSAARALRFDNAVGFPGTNNLACWLADLTIEVVNVPGMGYVHKGFWEALSSISTPLMALEGIEVTLGHSEGAALAILHGAQLCLAGRPPKAIYAFEPPRVSIDDTLAKLFARYGVPIKATQHGNDLVPMVPRITHDWQHPVELLKFGPHAWPFPNVEDHFIDHVIADCPTT